MSHRLIPISVAARRLGVCVRTLKRWLSKGYLRGIRNDGGHWRIPECEIYLRTQITRTNRDTTPTASR